MARKGIKAMTEQATARPRPSLFTAKGSAAPSPSLGDVETHADPAMHALQLIDVPPERAVLVGDSAADMGCAVNAGLAGAVGLKGIVSEAALREAGATHYCGDLAAVHALLMSAP